ncbi:MAG: hypothetical protein EWM72_00259 [Nitrospira sp.]|nr:MAG: hypothetical protein EWM72_00259 [Nitrospira sp.]
MIMAERNVVTKERLMDLERTIDALNGQLRNMQWKLQQAKAGSLTERFWKNLMSPLPGSEFMSAVCNRRVRPNTKLVDHVGTIRH